MRTREIEGGCHKKEEGCPDQMRRKEADPEEKKRSPNTFF